MINPLSFDWDAPLAPEERDRLLEQLADIVVARGLQMPISWMIEIHRPIMHIASQFGIAGSPFLAALFPGGPEQMQKYTKLMQDRANVDILLNMIDKKSLENTVAAR